MKDLLKELAPAQTLLILKPDSYLRNLLTYTLADLFLRERLQLINFDPKPVQGKPRFGFAGVVAGKKMGEDEAKLHEMVFLFPFYRKATARLVVKHLLQMAIQTAKTESYFKNKMLMEGNDMKPLFKFNLMQKIFGSTKLSAQGQIVQKELIRHLNVLDKQLSDAVVNDKQKTLEILNEIGGNILLLNSFKFDLVKIIGVEMQIAEEEIEGTYDSMPDV